MAIEGDVIVAIIVGGTNLATATIAAGVSWWAARRGSKDKAKQLESERSGEHAIAKLDAQTKFRDQVLKELDSVRADNQAFRAELLQHEAICEDKIRDAVERSERECEESTNRKLRRQAASIRKEYGGRISELERRVVEISEPLTDSDDFL